MSTDKSVCATSVSRFTKILSKKAAANVAQTLLSVPHLPHRLLDKPVEVSLVRRQMQRF
jgi:hypothetical protein